MLIFFKLMSFSGGLEVTNAKSSYCSSTSFQPGSYAHTPQGAWSHNSHHREQHRYHPVYPCGNHQWSAGESFLHLLLMFVFFLLITKDLYYFLGV